MIGHELSLKELIRAVSDELIESREERLASHTPPIFEVDELTIEAGFVITESDSGGGGFDLKILKADVKTDYAQETVHKISLKLRALSNNSAQRTLYELGDELPLRPREEQDRKT